MTGFRDAIAGRRLAIKALPDPGLTTRLAASLSIEGAGVLPKPAVDLDIVAERFLLCLTRGETPSFGDWNKIAWCLWTTRPAIAEHDAALDAVLGRVARMDQKRPYRQLASAYLTDFAPERPQLDRIAAVLSANAARAADPWSGLQIKCGIFEGTDAVTRLAHRGLNDKTSVQRLLESNGMGRTLSEGGFAEAIHRAGLKVLCAMAIGAAAERLETITRWCLRPDGALIFKTCRAEMARAIVQPFGNRVPSEQDRDLILGFLVSRFGDPRVSPGGWIGMDDVAEILKRWLTEQSLRQFFDVLDKIAQPHHWRYRRTFWQAYHDHNLIRNAWVIFGPDGATEARRAFGPDVRFGVFRSGGRKQILPGHAVLLMDLGQCIVADWSHNGYCNIWPISDPTRPRNLNSASYISNEVGRALPSDRSEANLNHLDMFSHVGSDNYVWQNRVARRLHELIGVRVPHMTYRVR